MITSQQDDEVFEWAKDRENMFIPIDEQLESTVENIVNGFNLYNPRTDRSGADPYVVALAVNHDLIVLSEEENSKSPKYVNIPDVCESFNLQCMNLLGLIDQEDWIF